jgi:SAM-dependent methyltransferase
LQAGFEVYAVEPNREMRVAAESALSAEPGFTSIDGSAEDSRLESASIDLITAAQAFHWFNSETAKEEFRRVLKPGGQLALIWNKRKLSLPFQQAYEAILQEFAPEYGKVNHMNLSEMEIQSFFATGAMRRIVIDNSQQLDFAGLLGRLKSSSYCPEESSPNTFHWRRNSCHCLINTRSMAVSPLSTIPSFSSGRFLWGNSPH